VTLIDACNVSAARRTDIAITLEDQGEHLSMSELPSINYMCANCGATATYQLVPNVAEETHHHASVAPSEIPSIDFRCSHCGARQTYMLVPDNARDQPE
jgi:DNA-directed RNA polymerase subunit RPC12/RpoP